MIAWNGISLPEKRDAVIIEYSRVRLTAYKPLTCSWAVQQWMKLQWMMMVIMMRIKDKDRGGIKGTRISESEERWVGSSAVDNEQQLQERRPLAGKG